MASRQDGDENMIVLGLLITFIAGVITGMEWYRRQYAELERTDRGGVYTRRPR